MKKLFALLIFFYVFGLNLLPVKAGTPLDGDSSPRIYVPLVLR